MELCHYLPKNGRGYPLDISSDYHYKPDGTPWCRDELPVRLDYCGYYWDYVDGRPTLIHGRKSIRGDWSASRWTKLRRIWTYLIANAHVGCDGVGFSFGGGPLEHWGWLCAEPITGMSAVSSCGEILARMAWQLERLRPGSFLRLCDGWVEHRHVVARLKG